LTGRPSCFIVACLGNGGYSEGVISPVKKQQLENSIERAREPMGEYHRGGGRAKSSVDVVGAAILAKEFPHYPSYQLTVVLSKAIVGR